MAIDHVRFCAAKYLKHSYGYRSAADRPDLAASAGAKLAAANLAQAGDVLGVQTTEENSDEINFVVTENGIFVVGPGRYVSYREISGLDERYDDKQDFNAIGLRTDDGSSFDLDVKSGHGKLRDAFAVSSFLGAVQSRLRDPIPAYRPE
jgi:hypothetical protein